MPQREIDAILSLQATQSSYGIRNMEKVGLGAESANDIGSSHSWRHTVVHTVYLLKGRHGCRNQVRCLNFPGYSAPAGSCGKLRPWKKSLFVLFSLRFVLSPDYPQEAMCTLSGRRL
jgi:hypothetical protein